MAQKQKEKKKEAQAAAKETAKKGNSKAVDTKAADDKAAKKAARMEKIKNRPAEQRPNSKQVDVIPAGTGKVETFGYAVRKTGTVVTSVLLDAKGNPIGISSVFVPGTKVKVKKNHGNIIPGVAGEGKGKKSEEEDEDDEDSED